MPSSQFCIRPDYITNPAITHDVHSGGEYWNARSIQLSYYYQFPVYRVASRLVKQHKLPSLIDVGCGIATKLSWLHKRHPTLSITGIDQPSAIVYCKRSYDFGEWLVEDFAAPTPWKAAKSPLVICSDVIEHVENPNLLLAYLKECVTDDGMILLSTPERHGLRGGCCITSPNRYHVREWSFGEFAEYCRQQGFTILSHFTQWPVKLGVHSLLLPEIVYKPLKGRSIFSNQACILKKA